MADKNIIGKLSEIQTQIKAPKNLYNSFGKYKYRNAESICEAVKPYLAATKTALSIQDDIEQKGEKLFIKATVTILDTESDGTYSTHAYAELDPTHKGMSADQITGCCSSYARKYALNAMFLLDDTKDADSDEYAEENNNKAKKEADKLKCARCGEKIKPMQCKDGEMSASAVMAYSLKKFGSAYCGECQKQLMSKAKEAKVEG